MRTYYITVIEPDGLFGLSWVDYDGSGKVVSGGVRYALADALYWVEETEALRRAPLPEPGKPAKPRRQTTLEAFANLRAAWAALWAKLSKPLVPVVAWLARRPRWQLWLIGAAYFAIVALIVSLG